MPQYTVKNVRADTRDWTSAKGGKMRSYRIDLVAADGAVNTGIDGKGVELAQRETTPPPKEGDTLDGAITERKWGENNDKIDLKFQKAQGAGGGGGRSWKPRPDDSPKVYASRQAAILRQHSQDMALRVMELAQASNAEPQEVMDALGVDTTIEREGQDPAHLGLVQAFMVDAGRASNAAWDLEDTKHRIADAMKEVA